MYPGLRRSLKFATRYTCALGGSAYLFSGGFLSSRHRPLLWNIAEHFGYGARGVKPLIPSQSASDFIGGAARVSVRCPESIDGNVSLLELLTLVHLVKQSSPSNVLEIGTFNGRTTLNLAANCPDEAKVYTLDLPRESIERTQLKMLADELASVGRYRDKLLFWGTDCEHKIVPLYADSASFDFASLGKMDLVFIDGSHSYQYVINDTQKALSIISSGGVIVWHDYSSWDDVTRALNDLFQNDIRLRHARHIGGTSLVYLKCDF